MTHIQAFCGGKGNWVLPMVTFGSWLRAKRTEKGLTLKTLAEMVDVTYTHLSKIENEKSDPHKDLVLALADALGVKRQDALLAFGGEPPRVSPDLEYIEDEDIRDVVRYYTGMPPQMRPGVKETLRAAHDLARQMEREATIGSRALDDDDAEETRGDEAELQR